MQGPKAPAPAAGATGSWQLPSHPQQGVSTSPAGAVPVSLSVVRQLSQTLVHNPPQLSLGGPHGASAAVASMQQLHDLQHRQQHQLQHQHQLQQHQQPPRQQQQQQQQQRAANLHPMESDEVITFSEIRAGAIGEHSALRACAWYETREKQTWEEAAAEAKAAEERATAIISAERSAKRRRLGLEDTSVAGDAAATAAAVTATAPAPASAGRGQGGRGSGAAVMYPKGPGTQAEHSTHSHRTWHSVGDSGYSGRRLPDVPEGWTADLRVSAGGQSYVVIHTPDGRRFQSLASANRHWEQVSRGAAGVSGPSSDNGDVDGSSRGNGEGPSRQDSGAQPSAGESEDGGNGGQHADTNAHNGLPEQRVAEDSILGGVYAPVGPDDQPQPVQGRDMPWPSSARPPGTDAFAADGAGGAAGPDSVIDLCPARSSDSDYAHDHRSDPVAKPLKGLLSEVLTRCQLEAFQHDDMSDEDDFSGSDYSDDEDSMSYRMTDHSPSSSTTSSPCSQPIPIPEPRSLPYSLAWHRARARAQQMQQQAYAGMTTKDLVPGMQVNEGMAVPARK